MCTVTYVPKGHQQFILTSSRDENVNRERALAPELYMLENVQALFPKDASKGGTWIGCTTGQRLLCLLNGAFENHERSDQFIKSRGLVVLDFFNAKDLKDFVNKYSFENVEPFTLIIVEYFNDRTLYEFRWDGAQKHLITLDQNMNHIWSSATLYNPEQAYKKALIFEKKVNHTSSSTELFNLHELGTTSNPELFKYHGIPEIQTLSITQLELNKEEITLLYKILETSEIFVQSLPLNQKLAD